MHTRITVKMWKHTRPWRQAPERLTRVNLKNGLIYSLVSRHNRMKRELIQTKCVGRESAVCPGEPR